MDPIIGGAVIGGATNILGTLFGNRSRKRAAERSFQQSKKMFDYQNAYNTPKMQMQRLKDAGLNPALMYGQGTTGNASGYPQAPVAQVQDVGAGAAQAAAAGASISLVDSQKKLNEANAIKSGIEGAARAGDYRIAKEMSKYQMSKLQSETTKVSTETQLLEQTFKHQKQTGMLKGDILGNLAKVYDININTSKGKEAAIGKLNMLLGIKLAGDLLPSFVNAISGIIKTRMGLSNNAAQALLGKLTQGTLSEAEKAKIIKAIFKTKLD